ncbi:MAG: M1 family aminopeptidase [Candidatus Kapaibacterium sp.]
MKVTLYILFILSLPAITNAFTDDLCSKGKTSYKSSDSVVYDSSIDINYYKLNLNITTAPNFLYSIADVKGSISPLSNSIFLNLSNSMFVDSVTGAGLSGFTHSNDLLVINFSSNISSFDLKIYYKGLPSGSGFGSFVFAAQNSYPVIWSLSEPYGASDWFPNKNTPSDKADSSEVWITCSSNLTGVSNGLLYETIVNPDNTKTYKWKSRYPIANYLISIAITNYEQYDNYYRYSINDSMIVNHYVYPGTLNSVIAELDKTPGMLQVFSDRYSQYPFIEEKYGHAQFSWGGAMEHQTISSMGVFNQGIIVHELAHQWFGDKVTCRNFNNIWLNEGFATYSEAIFAEYLDGKEAFDDMIRSRMISSKKAVGSLYLLSTDNESEIFNYNRTYAKGAMVVHMLRGITGDSVFYNILRSYLNDPALAYSTAVTEDLQRVAETVSGRNLNYFFQEWIYGENYPKYEISWDKFKNPNNTFDVKVKVSQKQNTNPTYFTMPIDLQITSNKGDTTFTVFNNAQVQEFSFTVKDEPLYITLDPDNKILKDKTGDEPVEPIDFKLFQNYPNPFNPETNITYMIREFTDVKLIIYDLLGREITKLVNQKQHPGTYSVPFSPQNLASGVYLYKLISGNITDSKKMVYIR